LNGINGLNVLSGPQLQGGNESQLTSPRGLIPKITKTRFSSIGTEIEIQHRFKDDKRSNLNSHKMSLQPMA
jgi:hypothetical protein